MEDSGNSEETPEAIAAVSDDWGGGGEWGESEIEKGVGSALGGGGGGKKQLWCEGPLESLGETDAASLLCEPTSLTPAPQSNESKEGVEYHHFPPFPVSTIFLDEEEEGEWWVDEDDSEADLGEADEEETGKAKNRGSDWDYAQKLWEKYRQEEKAGINGIDVGAGACGELPPEVCAEAVEEGHEESGDELGGHTEEEDRGKGESEGEEEEEVEEEGGEERKGVSKVGAHSIGGKGAATAQGKKTGDRRKVGGSKQRPKEDSGGGEKYEKTPLGERFMARFQARIAATPSHVLRYVWDAPSETAVLWPSLPPAGAPSPSSSSSSFKNTPPLNLSPPPACSHCGGPRRLEVQILPTVLYGLRVEDYAVVARNSNPPSVGSSPPPMQRGVTQTKLQGGMDFLSLLIFSCEASCEGGEREWCYAING